MIKDDLLDKEVFKKLQDNITFNTFSWYYQDIIAYEDPSEKGSFFTHLLYSHHSPNSSHFSLMEPILDILNPKSLIRIKANLYMPTLKLTYHPFHTDFSYSHKAAIFSINTNDGLTMLEDGIEVKSIENRLFMFDGSHPHRSTSCTDKKYRMNISFNYF